MPIPHHDPDRPHLPNSPEEILFNDNLREFTVKIEHICGLEINGKISQEEAYRRIRDLWKALKRSKKNLGIGEQSDEKGR
ncbi:MAG: DUF7219 family protein [Phycisphaeraceae bacterium]